MNKPYINHENRGLQVKNISACWLPSFTLHRKIGGTVYAVSGSYAGVETLDKKLRRIMEQSLDGEESHP